VYASFGLTISTLCPYAPGTANASKARNNFIHLIFARIHFTESATSVRVDSRYYRVNFDIVITVLSRCFVLIVALSIFAVTLPVRAEVPQPPRHRMGCCAHVAGERGHCGGGEPVKSQDRQCCPACTIGLSLFLASAAVFIFSPERGERFIDEIAASSSRSDRPPVPPPRA
jgi:hypothetical protein